MNKTLKKILVLLLLTVMPAICAKALVMTHAYSNAIIDKVEEAFRNGIVGNEDDDW